MGEEKAEGGRNLKIRGKEDLKEIREFCKPTKTIAWNITRRGGEKDAQRGLDG